MRIYLLLFTVCLLQARNTVNAQSAIKLFGHIGNPGDTVAYWFNDQKSESHFIVSGKDGNYTATIKVSRNDSLINFTFRGVQFSCEQALKTKRILSYLKHNKSMRYDLILTKDFCESGILCESTREQQKLEGDWINVDKQVLKLRDCSNYERETIVDGTVYVEDGSWSMEDDNLIQFKPRYLVNKETGALVEAGVKTTLSIKDDTLVSKENVAYKRKTLTMQEMKDLLKKK